MRPRLTTALRPLLVLALATPLAAQLPRPGYDGPLPSAAADAVIGKLRGTTWEDTANRFGGGTWRIDWGGVTPHALGPARGDMIEMRSTNAHGPHVRLTQATRAVCLPTRSDGDVVALLHLLDRPVPKGLAGEPSPEWQRALARMAALGEASAGLRAGLLRDPGQDLKVELLFWNIGDTSSALLGTAQLLVDGVALPLELRWPPKAEVAAGSSLLALEPGSTYEQQIDVRALAKAHGKTAILRPGPHMVELLLQPEPGEQEEPAAPLRSRKLTVEIAEKPPRGDK